MQIILSKNSKGKSLNLLRTIQHALKITNKAYKKNPIRLNDYVAKSERKGQFTLRCSNSSYIIPARVAPSGQHTRAVSWQAHREFMHNLLQIDNNAKIITSIEKYEGLAGFKSKYLDTYGFNVGSKAVPVAIGDLDVRKAA